MVYFQVLGGIGIATPVVVVPIRTALGYPTHQFDKRTPKVKYTY